MERYTILQQRMEKSLMRAGFRCQIFRAPRDLAESGCAYTVKVTTDDIFAVLYVLRRESLKPEKIFVFRDKFYREVVL